MRAWPGALQVDHVIVAMWGGNGKPGLKIGYDISSFVRTTAGVVKETLRISYVNSSLSLRVDDHGWRSLPACLLRHNMK